MDHITKVFETRHEAENVFSRLETIGVRQDQISMLASDEARNRHFALESSTKAEEGAATGATVGGIAAALAAAMLSAGAIAIPGMNIVVSGYLISALAGLGAGAATGGVLGALIGAGFSEHEAKLYEDELKTGNIIIAVKPVDKDQRKQVKEIFDSADESYVGGAAVKPSHLDQSSYRV